MKYTYLLLFLFLSCSSKPIAKKTNLDSLGWIEQFWQVSESQKLLTMDSQIAVEGWRSQCYSIDQRDEWEQLEFKEQFVLLFLRYQRSLGFDACTSNDRALNALKGIPQLAPLQKKELWTGWREGNREGLALKENTSIPLIYLVWEDGAWLLDLESSLNAMLRPVELKARRHPEGSLAGLLFGFRYLGLSAHPEQLLKMR